MENKNLKIARIRHFYDFESIDVVTHKEEITFYYNGWQTDKIEYFTSGFKEYLSVLDFNGEQLQFHAELSDYFDVEGVASDSNIVNSENSDTHENNNKSNGFRILIDFPKERPLLQNNFRTISLTEKIDYLINKPGMPFFLSVPFDEASHTYLYINKLPQYRAKIDKIFFSRDDIDNESQIPTRFFKLEETEEKEFLEQYETTSYYCITSSVPISDCNIFIGIEYYLRRKDLSWFYSGILFGAIVLLLNSQLITNRLSNSLSQISAISTIAITYLVVIKGWLFTKDIDDVVGLLPISFDFPIRIRFSDVYLLLIFLIFIEVIVAFYWGIDQNNNKNIEITVQYLIQNIFTL